MCVRARNVLSYALRPKIGMEVAIFATLVRLDTYYFGIE